MMSVSRGLLHFIAEIRVETKPFLSEPTDSVAEIKTYKDIFMCKMIAVAIVWWLPPVEISILLCMLWREHHQASADVCPTVCVRPISIDRLYEAFVKSKTFNVFTALRAIVCPHEWTKREEKSVICFSRACACISNSLNYICLLSINFTLSLHFAHTKNMISNIN